MPIYLKQFTKFPNAGDAVSSYIVSRLLGREIVLSDAAKLNRPNLIAVGSILHWADSHSVIWGSGLISSSVTLSTPPAKVIAVRGHLTRERLNRMGIPAPTLIGDPGLLISDFYRPTIALRRGVGIIPHYVDMEQPFVAAALEHGATLIDPFSPLETYLTAVASCEAVVSSSLHGVVFAHSFGIPALWVKLSPKVIGNGFKFLDYYSSIGFRAEDVPMLSEQASFKHAVDRVTLPKSEIDKDALRDALLAVATQLEEVA